jgi:branched-chain amino acid transport system ATP-binding protein
VRADEGRIVFDGRDIGALAPHARCRIGIGRSYQIPQPFGEDDGVRELPRGGDLRRAGLAGEAASDRAIDVLARTGLLARANRLAGGSRCSTASGSSSRARCRPGRGCCCSTRSPAG